MYKKLIQLHKAGEISFANVVTFKCVHRRRGCCCADVFILFLRMAVAHCVNTSLLPKCF